MTFGGIVAAVAGEDFVLMGATRGVSYGRLMISRRGSRRIFVVEGRILVGYTGLYAGFQHVHSILETLLRDQRYSYGIVPSVRRVTNTLSSILYSDRFVFPNPIEALVGGFNPDSSGPELYVVGGLGEVIPERYAAVGDGFEIALAVLESEYRRDMSVEEAKELLVRALKTAAARVMSNEPYREPDVLVVTRRFFAPDTSRIHDRRDRGVPPKDPAY